jgi:hypothetical protein
MKAKTLLLTYIIAILCSYVVYKMPMSIVYAEGNDTIVEILDYSEKIINGNKVIQHFYPYKISFDGKYYLSYMNNNYTKIIHPFYQLYLDNENTIINNCYINWYIKIENEIIKPEYYLNQLEKIGICDYGRIRIKYIVEPKKPLTEVVYFLSNYKGKISLINEIKGNVLYVDNTYGLTIVFDNLIAHFDDYTKYDNSHSIDIEKEFEVDNGTEIILHPDYSLLKFYGLEYSYDNYNNSINTFVFWDGDYYAQLYGNKAYWYNCTYSDGTKDVTSRKSIIVINTKELPTNIEINRVTLSLTTTVYEPDIYTTNYDISNAISILRWVNSNVDISQWNRDIIKSKYGISSIQYDENVPLKWTDYKEWIDSWQTKDETRTKDITAYLSTSVSNYINNVIFSIESEDKPSGRETTYPKDSGLYKKWTVIKDAKLTIEYTQYTPSITLRNIPESITLYEGKTTYADFNIDVLIPPNKDYTITISSSSDKVTFDWTNRTYSASEMARSITLNNRLYIQPHTAGTYSIKITGELDGTKDEKIINLTVGKIEIKPSLSTLEIMRGQTADFYLYVSTSFTISMSYSAPSGISVKLPSTISQSGTYNVTVSASSNASSGKLIIYAKYQDVTVSCEVIISVREEPTFQIIFDQYTYEVKQGKTINITGYVSSIEGYDKIVNLTYIGRIPSSLITLSPTNSKVPFTFTITIETSYDTPYGTYQITVTGIGEDNKTSQNSISLKVVKSWTEVEISDFYISPKKDNYYINDTITVTTILRNIGEAPYEGVLELSYLVDNIEITTYKWDVSLDIGETKVFKQSITLLYEGIVTFKSQIGLKQQSLTIFVYKPKLILSSSSLYSLLIFIIISFPSSLFYFKSKLEEIR